MARSICFTGAGASVPFGVPSMAEMVEQLERELERDAPLHLPLFRDIKSKLQHYESFDIEALITVLQDMIAKDPARVLAHPSVHYVSTWDLGFQRMTELASENAERNRTSAEDLLSEIKQFVARLCSIKEPRFEVYEALFQEALFKEGYDLRTDLSQDSPSGLNYQVFTTNYDPVIEAFFDAKRLPYECGEGQNRLLDLSNSNPALYGSDVSRFQIYKLHGSVNWYRAEDGRLRWGTTAAESGSQTLRGDQVVSELMIYPATQKYTFREPFYSMFHHLKECLQRSETCYVIGYSFRDEDILGLFHDAMDLNDRLRLCLIDPKADAIVRAKFFGYSPRIDKIPTEFSVESTRSLPHAT